MTDHISEGLAHVNNAIKYDQQGKYREATGLYDIALSHLKLALIGEADPQRRALVAQKINEYHERNLQLKQLLPAGMSSAASSTSRSILDQLPIIQHTPNITPASEMSRSEAFQTAVDLSERGRQEDLSRNYTRALALYKTALDYYLAALKAEPNSEMKKSISDRMKFYLERAEQLKPIVQQTSPSTATHPGAQQLSATVPFNWTSTAVPSMCAACGGLLMGSSVAALDRQWHPECFVGNNMCAGCFKPFSLSSLRYKIKDGNLYHPLCYEGTTGLTKTEIRSFIGTSSVVKFIVELPRRFFSPGEQFQFHFKIENQSNKKINKVVTYLFKTETFMETVGTNFERKAKTTESKLGRTEFCDVNFPLTKAALEGDFVFLVPSALFPSEVTGVDASFVREYELIIKCVLTRPLKDIKVIFGVTIQTS
jgi:hypothetical protein